MGIYISYGGEKKEERDWAPLILSMVEFRVGVFDHVGMILSCWKNIKDDKIVTLRLIFIIPKLSSKIISLWNFS